MAPPARRSFLDRADNWLLVAVVLVGVLIVLQIVAWVVHAVSLLIRLAVLVVVVYAVVRFVARRRDDD